MGEWWGAPVCTVHAARVHGAALERRLAEVPAPAPTPDADARVASLQRALQQARAQLDDRERA
jgi:hypothetical protein